LCILLCTAVFALAEALNAGRDVFEKARRLLPSLPAGRSTPPPATLGDAQALVQQKQEAAQQQHKEPKPKQKGGKEASAADQAFPGARIGGANDYSAYWTLVEVCSVSTPASTPATVVLCCLEVLIWSNLACCLLQIMWSVGVGCVCALHLMGPGMATETATGQARDSRACGPCSRPVLGACIVVSSVGHMLR
jgi:hypothetical protein